MPGQAAPIASGSTQPLSVVGAPRMELTYVDHAVGVGTEQRVAQTRRPTARRPLHRRDGAWWCSQRCVVVRRRAWWWWQPTVVVAVAGDVVVVVASRPTWWWCPSCWSSSLHAADERRERRTMAEPDRTRRVVMARSLPAATAVQRIRVSASWPPSTSCSAPSTTSMTVTEQLSRLRITSRSSPSASADGGVDRDEVAEHDGVGGQRERSAAATPSRNAV